MVATFTDLILRVGLAIWLAKVLGVVGIGCRMADWLVDCDGGVGHLL
ncbi:MAG: hypothetical protein V8Q79_07180 [Christensenellales bacterium]